MNIEKFMNVKSIIKHMKDGEKLTVGSEVNGFKVNEENLNKALLVMQAEKYVEEYRSANGNKSIICERLRDGYIGELVYTNNGTSYIQSVRGKPYGTIVSIKNGDEVSVGISYLDIEDMENSFPIVGEYLALQRAEFNKKEGKMVDSKSIKSKAKKQVEHFVLRSKAFFNPDKYSYSRGKEPVQYKNYKEIHERRKMILGK